MHMVIQFLIPGMENLNDTGCCSEILLIGCKFQKCFSAASVEKSVQELLVAERKAGGTLKVDRIYNP